MTNAWEEEHMMKAGYRKGKDGIWRRPWWSFMRELIELFDKSGSGSGSYYNAVRPDEEDVKKRVKKNEL